jgi:hypothetical protein
MSRTEFSTGQRARWRWLLYVALAFAGGLLTFVGARAQQRASDDATFRRLIEGYCAAWSSGNAEAPARFYAKDNGLVFYDLAPFAYHGWKEYHDGVQRELFANMASGSLLPGRDLKVTRPGPPSPCISPKKQGTVRLWKHKSATPVSGRSAEQTGFSCMSTSQPRWETSRLEEVQDSRPVYVR